MAGEICHLVEYINVVTCTGHHRTTDGRDGKLGDGIGASHVAG